MKRLVSSISMVFASGCIGALINSLAVWYAGDSGIAAKLGVHIAPHLTASWLYPRIVWGGIWGLLFLVPVFRTRWICRGFLLSLGPSLVQLLVVFPLKAHKGWLGMDLGLLTPIWVLLANAIWGLTASLWLRWMDK